MNTPGVNSGAVESSTMDWLGSVAVLGDPTYALIAGIGLAIVATCIAILRPPATKQNTDPLAGLFASNTLDTQLDRAAQRAQRTEQTTCDASVFRAKIFARKAAHPSSNTQRKVPPHRAERYDHNAVLAHLAQVMRAGFETGDEGSSSHSVDQSNTAGEWEEILLLPPPEKPNQDDAVAKAA